MAHNGANEGYLRPGWSPGSYLGSRTGVGGRQSAEIQREIRRQDRELTAVQKRGGELTPELLRLFIRKIVVHEKSTKWSEHALQTIEIHYSDISCIGGEVHLYRHTTRNSD